MEGQHGANRWREHLKDIEREKKLKQIMEDPEFEKLTPEQIALKIQELEHSVEAGAKPEEQFASGSQLAGLNKLSGEQLQRKIQDEQRHLAEYGTFKDKEFEDWAKTKMSPAERARFMAGVERIEKFAARGKRLAWKGPKPSHAPDEMYVGDPGERDRGDYGYAGNNDKDRIVRSKLAEHINPEPRNRGKLGEELTPHGVEPRILPESEVLLRTRQHVERLMPHVPAAERETLVNFMVKSYTSKGELSRAASAEAARRTLSKLSLKEHQAWEQERHERRITKLMDQVTPDEKPKAIPHAWDPRIQPTVEELYANSGHTLEKGPKAWRAQRDFMRRQHRQLLHGIKTGHLTLGVNEDGKLHGIDQNTIKRTAWGMVPNKDWVYTLNDLEKPENGPYKRNIEFYDTKTQFKLGKRDDQGQLIEGEVDQMAALPSFVRKYHQKLVFNEGERVPRHRPSTLPTGVDEVHYVPFKGLAGETFTMAHPTEHKSQYEIRDTQGRWHPSTRSEYEAYVPHRIPRDADPLEKARMREENAARTGGRRRKSIPKQIRYQFEDPSHLRLAEGQVDQLSIQLPEIKVPKLGTLEERRLITTLSPHTTRDAVLGNYIRAYRGVQQERDAQRALRAQTAAGLIATTGDPETDNEMLDMTAKQHGFSGRKEMQQLAAAGAAAGLYATRRQLKKGTIPRATNKAFNSVFQFGPIKRYVEKTDLAIPDHVRVIEDAYAVPLQNKLEHAGFMLKHPLSSPRGKGFGMDLGRWHYREHWISKDLREQRRFDRLGNEIEDIVDRRRYARSHINDGGLTGAFRRWRMAPALRDNSHSLFQNKDHELFPFTKLGEGLNLANEYLEKDHIKGPDGQVFKVTPSMRAAASDFHLRTRALRFEDLGRGEIPARTKEPFSFSGSLPHINKNWYIAGGVVGGALAAHYAYHKYQEHKKAPEDRIAYYNKILPGPMHYKKPYVRATGWTNIHGVKMPVRFATGVEDKRLALRPMDRIDPFTGQGYAKNAKIGLLGLRPGGAKGGSVLKSAVFYQDPMKRSFRRGTHEVRVFGHKVPGTLTITNWKKIDRKSTNPNRLDTKDMEDIIWAHRGTPWEKDVKNFYSQQPERHKILDMWSDPDVRRRIEKRRGAPTEVKKEDVYYAGDYINNSPSTDDLLALSQDVIIPAGAGRTPYQPYRTAGGGPGYRIGSITGPKRPRRAGEKYGFTAGSPPGYEDHLTGQPTPWERTRDVTTIYDEKGRPALKYWPGETPPEPGSRTRTERGMNPPAGGGSRRRQPGAKNYSDVFETGQQAADVDTPGNRKLKKNKKPGTKE